jgi:hypothetical protein
MPTSPPQSDDFERRYLPVTRFAGAINSGVNHVRDLMNNGTLTAVKDHGVTKVEQSPAEYLAGLPRYEPGQSTIRPGPGRGHRREDADQSADAQAAQ